MSYDMSFDCGPLDAATNRSIGGGTYAYGGTTEPWLNITYNYADHFYRIWPDGGIRSLYGKTAKEIIALIDDALPQLGDDVDPDYWKSTEGNAKQALINLQSLARRVPENSVLDGD